MLSQRHNNTLTYFLHSRAPVSHTQLMLVLKWMTLATLPGDGWVCSLAYIYSCAAAGLPLERDAPTRPTNFPVPPHVEVPYFKAAVMHWFSIEHL